MFDGDFEAWSHGPVHRPTYDRFNASKWNPINEEVARPDLTDEDREHIDDVLAAYGHVTAYGLERLTHAELPWREARGDLPDAERSDNVISRKTMRDFYAARAVPA